MFLRELELQNFRCFSQKKLSFQEPITFVTGDNGVGKTSILEAIHYLCYFKSFRSHIVQDVVHSGSESFFLKGNFDRIYDLQELNHSLQVGYFQKKKSIKLDQKPITSYKQILPHFQVITLTEDDIDLIKGYPAVRRAFIDQAVLFLKHEAFDTYNAFRQVVAHRNALLASHKRVDTMELEVWNHELWKHSVKIQQYRLQTLELIEKSVNQLLDQYFDGVYEVSLKYESKNINIIDPYEVFLQKVIGMLDQERILKRSLFGAHLDDVIIQIRGKRARIYASRGQQKLISLLCKVSWATLAGGEIDYPIMLIDDFISDFDKIRLSQLVEFFLQCKNQIILTAPFCDPELQLLMQKAKPEIIKL